VRVGGVGGLSVGLGVGSGAGRGSSEKLLSSLTEGTGAAISQMLVTGGSRKRRKGTAFQLLI